MTSEIYSSYNILREDVYNLKLKCNDIYGSSFTDLYLLDGFFNTDYQNCGFIFPLTMFIKNIIIFYEEHFLLSKLLKVNKINSFSINEYDYIYKLIDSNHFVLFLNELITS